MNSNLGDAGYLADEETVLGSEDEETKDYTDNALEESTQDIAEEDESSAIEEAQVLDGGDEEKLDDDFDEDGELDFEKDLATLKAEFPEIRGIDSIKRLANPEKYERFRRLGLTPSEAYMASGEHRSAARAIPTSPLSVTRQREGIPDRQLRMAREIFTGLTDVEIQALYKRVTK